MKPENTIENKQKFFAIYWGQKVFLWKYPEHCIKDNYITNIDSSIGKFAQCGTLILRPITEISDDDAIEVARLSNSYFPIGNVDGFKIEVYESFLKNKVVSWGDSYKDKCLINDSIRFSTVSDFLRQRGYLIGWMGLTPEEIIEYGWVKLRH